MRTLIGAALLAGLAGLVACGGRAVTIPDGSGSSSVTSSTSTQSSMGSSTGSGSSTSSGSSSGSSSETSTSSSACFGPAPVCNTGCPGPIVYASCDATEGEWICPEPECEPDAGPPDASPLDAGGPVVCGPMSCGAGDLCVEQFMGGGACEEPMDGGVCPPGTMLDGDCCVFSEMTYTCAPLPPSCDGTLTCGCATSLCQCMCVGASSGVLQCACDYP